MTNNVSYVIGAIIWHIDNILDVFYGCFSQSYGNGPKYLVKFVLACESSFTPTHNQQNKLSYDYSLPEWQLVCK